MMKKLFTNIFNSKNIILILIIFFQIILLNLFNYIDINLKIIFIFVVIISTLILLKPVLGIIIMLIISPFLSLPENLLLNRIFVFYVYLFLLTILSSIINKKIKFGFNVFYFFPLILFYASLFLSLLIGLSNDVNFITGLKRIFPFSLFILSFIVYWEIIDSKRSLKILFYSLLFVTVLNSFKIFYLWFINLNRIAQVILYTDIRTSWYGRNGISLITSNLLLIYLCLIENNKKRRFILELLIFLSIISIIITFTRTYWFSIIIGYLILFLSVKKEKRTKLIKIFAKQIWLFLILLFLMIIFNPNLLIKFYSWFITRIRAITPSSINLSALNRVDELKYLIPLIYKKFLFGYGLGASYFMYSINPFTDRGLGWVLTSYSHNFYLYHIYSTGIVGFLIFLYFYFSIINKSIKIYRNNKISISIFISTIFVCIFFSSFLFPEFNDKLNNLVLAVLIGFLGYYDKEFNLDFKYRLY